MPQRPDYRDYEPDPGPMAPWVTALFVAMIAAMIAAPWMALVLRAVGVL